VTLEFRNQPLGSILIRKVCSVNPSVTLPKAEFKVAYSDGTLIGDSNGVYRSDENGEVRIEGLIPGKSVVVTETKAPAGFLIDTQSQTIVIQAGKTVSVTMKNRPKGQLIIQKRDSQTNEVLSGAQFRITTAAGCEVGLDGVIGDATLTQNGIFTTDSQGEIRITNLAPGAYVLSEIKAPDGGYVIDNPSTNVVIGPNGDTQTVVITNTRKGNLIVEKYDSVTKQPLKNAQFKIVTASGELVPDNEGMTSTNGLYTTGVDGRIVLSKINPGTYLVSETRSPDNYQADPTPQTVVVNAGDTQTLRFYDDPLCTLTLLKRDAVTKKPLKGAEFLVKDSTGQLIGPDSGIYTTGIDGTVTVSGLTPDSTIIVSEYKAPTGYVKDETPKNIVVRTGVANSLIFDDEPATTLIIQKFIEGTANEPLSGVAFKVTDGAGAAVGPDDGVYYTDRAGEIVLSGLEPGRTVKAREIKTVEGYVLDGTPQDILIKAGEVQRLTFWNKRDCSLTILKQSTAKEPLTGAVFLVTDEDGGAIGTNNGRYTSDRNGLIVIPGLQPGQILVVTEEKAPNGFVKDMTPKVIKIKDGANSLIFENAKAGSLVINKRSSLDKKTPLKGVTFKITTSTGEFLPDENGKISSNGLYYTDKNGQIILNGIVGTLVVTEQDSIPGYTIHEANRSQTVEIKPDDTQTLYWYNDPLCSLTLTKLDSVTGKPVPNTEFTVKDGNGNIIGRYTTGKDGTVTVGGLIPGSTIVVSESRVPEGYVLDTTPQTIIVKNGTGNSWTSGGSSGSGTGSGNGNDLTFENDPKTTLTIEKYLETETGNQPLKGVTFLVTDSSGAVVGPNNGEYITDENGRIIIANLEPGITISAKEIKVPEGVILDSTPKNIKIKTGEGQTLRFVNKKAGTLVIRKLDKVSKAPLSNVEFELTYAEGGYVDAANGHLSSKGRYKTNDMGEIRVSVTGTVVVKEVTPCPGYVLDEATRIQSITVNPADTQTLVVYNEPLCSLTLTKLDATNGKPIPNTEFTLKDGDGNILGKYITGADGTVTVTGLIPNSTVVVVESKVPSNYVLDPTPHTIIVRNGSNSLSAGTASGSGAMVGGTGSGNNITVENIPKTTLTIEKVLETETGDQPLKGVTFLVTDSSGAVVGNSNGEFITDENGRIVISNLEPGMTITAKEIKVPGGVVLDSTPKSIEIKGGEGGQTLRFVNKKAGNLIINKVDGIDKHPLSGVRFKITYADGSNVDQNGGTTSTNGIYTTDSNGQIKISGIVGTVIITEIETIDGYYIKEENRTQTVQINANDTQTVTVYNVPTQALVIQKFETGSKDKPLAGVEFLITDSSGTYVGPNNGIYKTDQFGRITIKDLTPGTVITARETKCLDGYVLDSTPQSIEIKSGEVQKLTFYNSVVGGLELIKVSEADKTQRIKGVTFEIRKMDGALIDTVTTGDNGRVHVSLDAGDYYCVEIEAAEGFKIDSTPHYFTVKDNETTTLTVTNAPFSGIIIHKVNSVTKEGIYDVKFLLYDQNKNPIGEYSTDDQGYIYIDDLTVQGKGKLFIRELEAAPGYELDKQYKTIYVQPGKTVEIEWENTPITGQFQIHKFAAEYNEVTGTPAGTPLQGAVYEISEARSGKVVDYITTDARGVAASKPLPLGRYKIVETTAPAYWQVSGIIFDETLEYSGQIIKVSDYDKPSNLGVTITKRGNAETLAGSSMRYDFTVANTSNVPLSDFYWHDRIPTDAARATIFTTGTYSARLNYRILYKTNYSATYQVLASNLITSSNYSFSLNAIPTQAGEYVTDIYVDFGKVPVGFQSVANPTLTVTVSGTAANGYQLVNRADVGGKYQGTWQTGQATWVTVIRKLTPTYVPKLPKTGY